MGKLAKPDDATIPEELKERLDIIIALLMPPAVRDTDSPQGLQLEILKLCDYDHTTDEIRKAVGKTLSHVNKELSLLRSKGMMRTVKRDGRQVHIRLQ